MTSLSKHTMIPKLLFAYLSSLIFSSPSPSSNTSHIGSFLSLSLCTVYFFYLDDSPLTYSLGAYQLVLYQINITLKEILIMPPITSRLSFRCPILYYLYNLLRLRILYSCLLSAFSPLEYKFLNERLNIFTTKITSKRIVPRYIVKVNKYLSTVNKLQRYYKKGNIIYYRSPKKKDAQCCWEISVENLLLATMKRTDQERAELKQGNS